MFDKHCLISVFSFYPFFLLSKWIDIHRFGGSLIFKTRLTNQTNCVCVCVHIIHIYMTIDRNEIHLSRQLKELEREGCTRRKLLNKIPTIPPSLSFYTLSGKKTKVERKWFAFFQRSTDRLTICIDAISIQRRARVFQNLKRTVSGKYLNPLTTYRSSGEETNSNFKLSNCSATLSLSFSLTDISLKACVDIRAEWFVSTSRTTDYSRSNPLFLSLSVSYLFIFNESIVCNSLCASH